MALARRVGGLFGKERRERELADEIASHLALHIEESLSRGMSREEARRQALIQLGGIEMTKEIYREQRGLPMLETLAQDVRFGMRMLWTQAERTRYTPGKCRAEKELAIAIFLR